MAKTNHAWTPPPWEDSDARAVHAVMHGEADAEMQRRAMKWIIEKCCGTYEQAFRSGKPDDTAFALGRQFVGQQIIALPQKLDIVKARRKV